MMTDTPSPTADPPDWLAAARRLLGDDVTIRDEAGRTVTVDGRDVSIRAWEPPATVERVTAIRALLARIPDDAGIPRPVGEPDAVVMLGGFVNDACATLDGLPLNRHGRFRLPGHGEIGIPLHETADPGDVLVQAARTLGIVHEATRGRPELAAVGRTSAVALHRAVRARWQESRKRLGAHAASLPEVRRWLRCGNRVVPIAGDRLRAAGEVASGSPVLLHGNIWPADLLVDEPSRPTALLGVAGWTSALAGSPVIDLAQLSARVAGWSEATVESVLGAYSDVATLPPAARRLVPVVAAVDLLDQLTLLLEIAYLDDAIANDPAQPFIRGGIKVLLRSLEQLTNVLAPPEPGTRRPGGGPAPRSGAPRARRSPRRPAAGQPPRRSGRSRSGRG
jgi:hypothetical protein